MWRLLLCFAVIQLGSSVCPGTFDLVKDGECRGLVSIETLTFDQAATTAIAKCDAVPGQPVIIHNEEHQTYWKGKAPPTNDGFLILGIICNTTSRKYVWADGSAIDYKPSNGYNQELDTNYCYPDYSWDIHPDGYWSYGGQGAYIQAFIYCTQQLQQPPLAADGCDNFEDDADDGVCYQIGALATDYENAQLACKHFGANLASIHNQQENAFVRRLAVSKGAVNGVFLGASTTKDGTFAWVDGSKMDFENYYPGFPKKNFGECLAMDTTLAAGQWMNVDCFAPLPVACVRNQGPGQDSVCTGEDYDAGQIITSPGFPNSASTPCAYFLTAPPGKKVQVRIILLEANSCCDSLTLYDGTLGAAVIAKLSGSIRDQVYTTKTSNIMRVSWDPNGGVNVKGMVISYSIV